LSCLTPYKVPQNIDGRFLQWTAINYFLETQEEPIEICPPAEIACTYTFPDLTETYKIPVQTADTLKWIMNKNELTIDGGSTVANIKIGIVQQGVLVAEDIGTITEAGSQYFCIATIPCLDEACDYQIVLYDDSIVPPLNCGIYAGSTLQDVIDDSITLSQVLDCTLNDFL
jgi:hypothetical protein